MCSILREINYIKYLCVYVIFRFFLIMMLIADSFLVVGSCGQMCERTDRPCSENCSDNLTHLPKNCKLEDIQYLYSHSATVEMHLPLTSKVFLLPSHTDSGLHYTLTTKIKSVQYLLL